MHARRSCLSNIQFIKCHIILFVNGTYFTLATAPTKTTKSFRSLRDNAVVNVFVCVRRSNAVAHASGNECEQSIST